MRVLAAALASSLALLPDAAAQSSSRALVVTATPAPRATTLLEVDTATGTIANIGRFAADGFAPLAVGFDPATGAALAAVDLGAQGSRLVRLDIRGSVVVQESVLGDVPGRVTGLAFGGRDEIVMTIEGANGGVYVMPRRGGPASLRHVLPRASAMGAIGVLSTAALIVQSGEVGPPVIEPALWEIRLDTLEIRPGLTPLTGYRPLQISDLSMLPNGAATIYFSNDNGTVAESTFFSPPEPTGLPQLAPGGTRAARGGVVLGGRADPFLRRIDAFGPAGPRWVILAGPLPGDPVDFEWVPNLGRVNTFGERCPVPSAIGIAPQGGPPTLGNGFFGLGGHGATANAPITLILGTSESRLGALALPLLLPGGCRLLISPEVALGSTASPFGSASQTIGIPNASILLGAVFYAEWLQINGSIATTSDAAAIFIGS